MTKTIPKTSDHKGPEVSDPVLMVVVSILVLFATLLAFWLWSRRRQSRRSVLLTGLSDSGKTLIFSQLLHSQFRQTHTSITENIGEYQADKGVLEIVDIPGQERVRDQLFDKHKRAARALAFIIDSVTLQKDVRDVAEYLYNILSDSVIAKNRPYVLILCNKQDQTLAKGSQIIKSLLEKEMNLVRKTKASQLQSVDPSQNNTNVFLGKKDKDFEFEHLSYVDVQLAECCAVDENEDNPANLEYLSKWLNQIS